MQGRHENETLAELACVDTIGRDAGKRALPSLESICRGRGNAVGYVSLQEVLPGGTPPAPPQRFFVDEPKVAAALSWLSPGTVPRARATVSCLPFGEKRPMQRYGLATLLS